MSRSFFGSNSSGDLLQSLVPVAGLALEGQDRDNPNVLGFADEHHGVRERFSEVATRGQEDRAEAGRSRADFD
jgi:hypothetical protein